MIDFRLKSGLGFMFWFKGTHMVRSHRPVYRIEDHCKSPCANPCNTAIHSGSNEIGNISVEGKIPSGKSSRYRHPPSINTLLLNLVASPRRQNSQWKFKPLPPSTFNTLLLVALSYSSLMALQSWRLHTSSRGLWAQMGSGITRRCC